MDVVNIFGPEGIHGSVEPSDGPAPQIYVTLNGIRIAETGAGRATDSGGGRLGFKLNIAEVFRFIGPGDIIQVLNHDTPIMISGHGPSYVHAEGENSRAHVVLSKINSGFIFNKRGRFRKKLLSNEIWKRDVFALYRKLRSDFKEHFGYDLLITYGTLLGAIREGNFIKQDDDFDTAYISKHIERDRVNDEVVEILDKLFHLGYRIKVGKSHILVSLPGGKAHIDVFFSWFTPNGDYGISFGYHGTPVKNSPEFSQMVPARLGEEEILVTANSESLLAQMYGEGWKVPDQGFSHGGSTRKIDRKYRISEAVIDRVYWDQFHRDHDNFSPSGFARLVPDKPSIVLDLGCGAGRDSSLFAELGHEVIAIDTSYEGIAAIKRGSKGGKICALVGDISTSSIWEVISEKIRALRVSSVPIIYLRWTLNSLSDEQEALMLNHITSRLTEFALFCEFRTLEDEQLPKEFKGRHFRRFIDTAQFIERLTAANCSIVHQEQGTGLSPYKAEDPILGRVIATKGTIWADNGR